MPTNQAVGGSNPSGRAIAMSRDKSPVGFLTGLFHLCLQWCDAAGPGLGMRRAEEVTALPQRVIHRARSG